VKDCKTTITPQTKPNGLFIPSQIKARQKLIEKMLTSSACGMQQVKLPYFQTTCCLADYRTSLLIKTTVMP